MIAFVSNRVAYEGNKESSPANNRDFNVYVMDADGSNVRSLAPDVFLGSYGYTEHFTGYPPYAVSPSPAPPVWSSSGELAFLDSRSRTLYTVHPDKPGKVTAVGQSTTIPAWSPDGEWIAWVHSEPDAEFYGLPTDGTIYVARADGTEKRRVFQMTTPMAAYPAVYVPEFLNLSWAPDGQSFRLVYAPHQINEFGLYQISLDGSDSQLIAEISYQWRIVIAWSPDGSRVAVYNLYGSSGTGREDALYTIASDGSDKRVLVGNSR